MTVAGLCVDPDVVEHPLLGDAHLIVHEGEPITAMSAIDWDRPTQIPTVAEPRKLPRGSGSMLINEIASRAQRAGVQVLRYAGPYPTPALFTTLLRSFRTAAIDGEGFALHAGWWTHLAPRGVQAFALAVSDALATVITQRILDEVMT